MADADSIDQLRVESAVLPIGAKVPSLQDLRQHPDLARGLASQSLSRQPQGAAETVGPAITFGELSAKASVRPRQESTPRLDAEAASAGAVPYPEPAHSMTSEQCFKALNGTGKKFYIKSRYAVCSGASFTQTWFKNNKPVGQSQFVLVAEAVIAKSSRTITVQYDYLHMDQVGQSGAGGMMISPDASLPKKWPSTATIRQGGSIPAPRSWAAIKADPDPSFEHTVTVDAGQGSGRIAARRRHVAQLRAEELAALEALDMRWIPHPSSPGPFLLKTSRRESQ
ncbi:hypothetical protein IPZ61_00060 [Streptomyces sioyaensis]|uniref:hypothetical protein n=1 Tax=Streptomyces sioyaensis TaxID=67364 RepID=UPI001F46E8A2|nr:hypothetical protein [Streptomyces sioyaensis]MCF3171746.1 hypothetical protein [Streptomyces sioyaensis]